MARGLDAGYTQATDLSEFIVQTCRVDYRSAYVVVGRTVREASRQGIAGRHITGAMLDEAAMAETGQSWGLAAKDLTAALDPRAIIETRIGTGGAAPAAVESMIASMRAEGRRTRRRRGGDAAGARPGRAALARAGQAHRRSQWRRR